MITTLNVNRACSIMMVDGTTLRSGPVYLLLLLEGGGMDGVEKLILLND